MYFSLKYVIFLVPLLGFFQGNQAVVHSFVDYPTGGRRLLIVSNRLPLTLQQDETTGEPTFTQSSGGMVSALLSIKGVEMKWIGWPGGELQNLRQQNHFRAQMRERNYEPVFLSKELENLHYNGYSNSILWPLFHDFKLSDDVMGQSNKMFDAYFQVNQLFANTVLEQYQAGDVVWVHDYHLMLLPDMLRVKNPSIKLGFFLHTAFPSYDFFTMVPYGESLLRNVLASDLVGFQTKEHQNNFVECCRRILGITAATEYGIPFNNRVVRIGAFPIGIDPDQFRSALKTDAVRKEIKSLKKNFKGRKVIVGVERLDYIKGIPQKLLAFERFLQQNPEWVGKVVLMQVAVPSRTEIKQYKTLKGEAQTLVKRINNAFSKSNFSPVHYVEDSVPFYKLVALYSSADVCLITSIRDGMNLVSFEFLASQEPNDLGVLILSKFAGSANSLSDGSIIIDPSDIPNTALAIKQALQSDVGKRHDYLKNSQRHFNYHTVQNWAAMFLKEMNIKTDF